MSLTILFKIIFANKVIHFYMILIAQISLPLFNEVPTV